MANNDSPELMDDDEFAAALTRASDDIAAEMVNMQAQSSATAQDFTGGKTKQTNDTPPPAAKMRALGEKDDTMAQSTGTDVAVQGNRPAELPHVEAANEASIQAEMARLEKQPERRQAAYANVFHKLHEDAKQELLRMEATKNEQLRELDALHDAGTRTVQQRISEIQVQQEHLNQAMLMAQQRQQSLDDERANKRQELLSDFEKQALHQKHIIASASMAVDTIDKLPNVDSTQSTAVATPVAAPSQSGAAPATPSQSGSSAD